MASDRLQAFTNRVVALDIPIKVRKLRPPGFDFATVSRQSPV
jgi:hypothetical protein